jgi:hypothetical protein
MATVSFTYPAGDGELFEPGSFDSVIGEFSDLNRGHDQVFHVEVVGAVVAADGRSVEFTLDTDAELTVKGQALIGFALRQKRTM